MSVYGFPEPTQWNGEDTRPEPKRCRECGDPSEWIYCRKCEDDINGETWKCRTCFDKGCGDCMNEDEGGPER